MPTTTRRSLDQFYQSPASRSALKLPAKLRPWVWKMRISSVLLMLVRHPLMVLIHGRPEWRRLLRLWGLYPRATSNDQVWIHADGPGEVRVAIALVLGLPEGVTVVITSDSPGQRLAKRVLGDRVETTYLPLFFSFAVRGFLRRYSPRQLILIEAVDPLVCLRLVQQELPIALVNGWFSKRWVGAEFFFLLLDRVQIFGVQDEEDLELLVGLGTPRERISVTGEMKFDAMVDPFPELEAQIQELAGDRPILIAGSTHAAEEPQILDAFERLGGGDRALLVLAPRWLNVKSVEKLLRNRRIVFVRRSLFPTSGRPAVVFLDTRGELAALYRIAAAAFVGGSLPPLHHGHNPIEPARFAIPIAVGPNMMHFQHLADLFDRAGAWQRVTDAGELARVWSAWLDAPDLARQMGQRAANLVESHQGLAISKALTLLRPFLGLDNRAASPLGPFIFA